MHSEKMQKARELATSLMCHQLANSDVGTVEYAGETLKEICDYCDRMRQHHDVMISALEWYAGMAKRMGDAAIRNDSQAILTLMKDVAVDYGGRARNALSLPPNTELSRATK